MAAFHLDMREGDYVITPTDDTEWLRYGRVTGATVYAAADDGYGFPNRRSVDWATTPLRRHDLSESLQKTLGSLRTVFAVRQREEFLAAIGQPDPASDRADVSPPDVIGVEPEDPTSNTVEPAPDPAACDEVDPETGMVVERDDPEPGAVERPFDPARIRIHTVQIVVDQLMSRIQYGEIDLAPDFQRMPGIWHAEGKSRLIESLLLRIPIPVFYVAADEDENWAVVDGLQRLSTIRDYVTGRFPLTRLEYRGELDGRRYDELPRAMQRQISETQFIVNVIEPGTPPEVMFNIFRRINTGGVPLNGHEIRHALNPGPVREYLKALARSTEFVYATNGSIKPNRMADRECVLRFLSCLPHGAMGALCGRFPRQPSRDRHEDDQRDGSRPAGGARCRLPEGDVDSKAHLRRRRVPQTLPAGCRPQPDQHCVVRDLGGPVGAVLARPDRPARRRA